MATPPMGTQTLNDQNKPLTVGDWLITLIVLSIPLVGLIFLLYWALSSSSNINRKNFCIAYIVIAIIIIALVVALMFLGVLAGLMGDVSLNMESANIGLPDIPN